MTYLALNSQLSREPKSTILCESVKQTSQIYDLMMVAYSVSTPLTLGRGVSYKDGRFTPSWSGERLSILQEKGIFS